MTPSAGRVIGPIDRANRLHAVKRAVFRFAAGARETSTPRVEAPATGSGVHLDHHALREDLLDLGVAMGDALLVGVAQELLEGGAVLLDPERERIAIEHVTHAARVGGEPGQRIA